MKTEISIQASPEAKKSLTQLAKHWWLPLIEGILSIIVGIYAGMHFGSGFMAVSIMVAAFLFASGMVGLCGALVSGDYEGKFLTVILSVLRLVASLILVVIPGMAEMYLLIIAGAAFLTLAINMIVLSLQMKKYKTEGWGWMLALGIILVINALILIANPLISVVMISASVCAELIISGVHDILVALQMKKLKAALETA